MLKETIYTVPVLSMDGTTTTLAPYQGQIMLLVNVASRCGFTPQYADLETLYKDYKARGVLVAGFPCNQFLHQEPGSNTEIQSFAATCFHITFPLFGKLCVKGAEQAPLYQYIKAHLEKKPLKFMPWNFTKVLVSRDGRVLRQYPPTTSIKKVRQAIDRLL